MMCSQPIVQAARGLAIRRAGAVPVPRHHALSGSPESLGRAGVNRLKVKRLATVPAHGIFRSPAQMTAWSNVSPARRSARVGGRRSPVAPHSDGLDPLLVSARPPGRPDLHGGRRGPQTHQPSSVDRSTQLANRGRVARISFRIAGNPQSEPAGHRTLGSAQSRPSIKTIVGSSHRP
jgi:hypothetical protein